MAEDGKRDVHLYENATRDDQELSPIIIFWSSLAAFRTLGSSLNPRFRAVNSISVLAYRTAYTHYDISERSGVLRSENSASPSNINILLLLISIFNVLQYGVTAPLHEQQKLDILYNSIYGLAPRSETGVDDITRLYKLGILI
ncbi:hypothetical protein V491_07468, partial [Pseudogymnoascus sp. VKM F-3775]